MYVFLSGLGLLVVVGLHQLLESRKVKDFNSHDYIQSHKVTWRETANSSLDRMSVP